MKYDYEFMHQLENSSIYNKNEYMKKEHGVSEATYYRWLKKYRNGIGADKDAQEKVIADMENAFSKKLAEQREELVAKSNALLEENMKAYEYYVSSLILVHTDVYLDDLLENTKAIFSPKTLR